MKSSDDEYNIITRTYQRFVRRIGKRRKQIALCFFLASVFAAFFCTGILSFGYNAYIDGQYIGVVRSRANIESKMTKVSACLSNPIEKSLHLYPRIVFNNAFTSDGQTEDNLKLASGQTHGGNAPYILEEKKYDIETDRNPEEPESLPTDEEAVETAGVASGIFARPLPGAVTSSFGQRWGRVHKGTDFAGDTGDDVKASDGGVVAFAGYESSFGNLIIIDHNNGYETYYAHLSAIYVKNGDKIKKGDIIGAVGNTGNSQGPHLHFEIRENGEAKNPLEFLPGS